MAYEKVIDMMERNINASLKERNQTIISPSELKIAYSSTHNGKAIFLVTVTHVRETFQKGIGFAIITMRETLVSMGFTYPPYLTQQSKDEGYTYTFSIPISKIEKYAT